MIKKHHIAIFSVLAILLLLVLFVSKNFKSDAASGYSIAVTSASVNGFTVSVNGTASASPYVGQSGDQGVYVTDWGDGTPAVPTLVNSQNLNIDTVAKTFNGTWSASHTYNTSGTKSSTFKVCHQGCTGGEGASTATATVTINSDGSGSFGGSSGDTGGGSGSAHFDGAPTVTLLGTNPMIVTQGSIFIDPGATAFDQEDGDVTSSIVVTGAVDTSVIGEYVLTYTAMDYWKQANKADRTVIVKELTPVVEEKITVVPTDAPCTAYLNKFILPNRKNDKDEVKKLQKFLNDKFKAVLVVDGIYGKKSISEVKKFQEANADLILKPWAKDNSVLRGTGLVYMTTIRVINNIMCPTLNLPLPEKLVPISENLDLKQ